MKSYKNQQYLAIDSKGKIYGAHLNKKDLLEDVRNNSKNARSFTVYEIVDSENYKLENKPQIKLAK